jgi:hypothetical protein
MNYTRESSYDNDIGNNLWAEIKTHRAKAARQSASGVPKST